ncbi:MAG: DNA mismatch repair endonuclease MutL [Myxococcota bacterium]
MTTAADAPRVAVLPDALANQIAAGEVVERPASVVKELVENAIDAGAARITIEIADAGKGLVRVVDDGEGMSAEDARTAVLRHATSKIRTADDLSAIGTLGFRGEALPSIASVSRFTLLTRRESDEVATRVSIDGGGAPRVEPAAAPPGTIIEVRDLFWNVPARLKFLKSDGTESAHVSQLVTSFALGHPHIHFKLLNEGKVALDFPAAKRLFDRAVQALGKAAQKELHEVAFDGPVRVAGFVSAPQFARGTPNLIITFVNGRRVKDRTVQHAIVSAYGSELGSGRFPQAVLYVHLDPHAVDVNVHPTKAEVRLQNPSLVHEAVLRAVQATLARRPWAERAPLPLEQAFRVAEPAALQAVPTHAPIPVVRATELRFGPPVVFPSAPAGTAPVDALGARADASPPAPLATAPLAAARPTPFATLAPTASVQASRARVIGQLASGLVVIESADGSVLVVDPHVADRERIVRELELAAARGAIATQPLLMPAALELGRKQARAVAARVPDLAHVGLWVEPFGGQTFQVMGMPVPIARAPAGRVLDAVAALLEREPRAEGAALLRAIAGAAALPRATPLASFYAASLAEPHAAAVVGRLSAAELRRGD